MLPEKKELGIQGLMKQPKAKIIISRFKENFDWVKKYTDNYLIYNKGEPIDDSHIINAENIGGNQRDIFRFICDYYDDLPNLMADFAFRIILAEDQYTLNKLLQIRSLWIPKDGGFVPASNYEFYKFKDEEEALAEYDDILNIILNYQDKIPFWKEEEPTSSNSTP